MGYRTDHLDLELLTDGEVAVIESLIRGERPDIPPLSSEKLQRGGYLVWQDDGPHPSTHALQVLGAEAARRG